MKKLTEILGLNSDDELFEYFIKTLKVKGIITWDYFVNWEKVFGNIENIEKELNLLNYLIGKDNVEEELTQLILEYPQVINAIPVLLAIRFKKKSEQKFNILVERLSFTYENFDLSINNPNKEQAEKIATFFVKTGLGDLVKDKRIKNFVDYATGVEVGIDSNGRKNRGGHQMEKLVEPYVQEVCRQTGAEYLKEATAKIIKEVWDLDVKVDKSSRRIDFVINKNGKLFFIEVNFYGGGGSKLKSTATEYVRMAEFWNKQGIEFIWITDGSGWLKTQRPLREYFDKAEWLLNLEMLRKGVLKEIIK